MTDLENIPEKFQGISLEEMDNVQLLNRMDTKFVFSQSELPGLLEKLSKDYRILEVNGIRINRYKTLYFDSPGFNFFLDHHNEKGNRFKIRIRKYIESDICFLEIKNKIKGRTIKSRIPIEDFELNLSEKSRTFIQNTLEEKIELNPTLWNEFHRITLVNNKDIERLTIDFNLSFTAENDSKALSGVAIAELKQEKQNRNSIFALEMKERGIRPMRISKYCIGALKLHDNLKYNNFKEKLLALQKISNNHG